MQVNRYIADRMREVEADRAAVTRAERGDRSQIEALAGGVLHTRPQDQRDAIAFARQHVFDLRRIDGVLARHRRQFNQIRGGITAMKADLRCHGVAIRRERPRFDQDLATRCRRPIEADHHQMQIGG